MDRKSIVLLSAAAFVLAAAAIRGSAPVAASALGDGRQVRKGVDRDPARLVPAFRARLERVFAAMRREGFNPFLWEAYRSPERAKQLAVKGTGTVDSLHIYGAAADVVDAVGLWTVPKGFYASLARNARAEGLTSGADFGDPGHVQAVSVKDQKALRASADPAAFVASRLA